MNLGLVSDLGLRISDFWPSGPAFTSLSAGCGFVWFDLSGLEVQKGQEVKARQILGRTGETGLAAGDHLHFSMILQGVQVNPLEWWDPRWVQQHVLDRVAQNWEP